MNSRCVCVCVCVCVCPWTFSSAYTHTHFLFLSLSLAHTQAGRIIAMTYMVGVCLLWTFSYVFRVGTKDMTYSKQLKVFVRTSPPPFLQGVYLLWGIYLARQTKGHRPLYLEGHRPPYLVPGHLPLYLLSRGVSAPLSRVVSPHLSDSSAPRCPSI